MTKRNLTRIVTIISILLLSLVVMCFTLGNGESSGLSWRVEPLLNKSDNSYLNESVIVEKEGIADSVFVRIGNVYNTDKNGRITFTVDCSNSETEIKKTDYLKLTRYEWSLSGSEDSVFAPGWYLLKKDLNISYRYIKFSTAQSFEFDEIIFLDKDGACLKTTCYGGYDNTAGRKFVSAADDTEKTFTCVTDGQNSFSPDSKSILSAKEEGMLFTALNLYAYDGSFVSEQVTPFGAILNGLGIFIFGNTTFGIRFVPFIFSVLTTIMFYFFAEKIFGSSKYGVIAVVAWVFSGVGLSLGGIATSTSSALFFLLASFYCFYHYYSSKDELYGINRYKPLILGGVSYSLCLACEPYALAVLPAAVVLCVLSIVKPISLLRTNYSLSSGLEREYARERYVGAVSRSIIWTTVSLLVVPFIGLILCYSIFYPLYSVRYGDIGFFSVAFSAIGSVLVRNTGSNMFGWLIGLGSEELTAFYEGASRYVFFNKAEIVICFALMIFAVIHFFAANKCKSKKEFFELLKGKGDLIFLLLGFCLTILFEIFFGVKVEYSRFAYSLIFLLSFIVYSYKEYRNTEHRTVFGVLFALSIVVISLFFLLSLLGFLGIELSSVSTYFLYGWMC